MKTDNSLEEFLKLEEEEDLHRFSTYVGFARRVSVLKRDFVRILTRMNKQGYSVIGFGASAKGISLMNYCGIKHPLISEIIDDTPAKQGRFTPGSNIKIVKRVDSDPDYIVLLAWNFAKEIMKKTRKYRARYIVPIPKVKIL